MSSGAAGGESAWNDTWAKELTDEERARALASLGEALAGGTTLSADAASTWAKTERRTGPRRGSATRDGDDAARGGRLRTRRASAYEADADDPFAGAATVGGGPRDDDGAGTESGSRSDSRSRDFEGPDDADSSGDSDDGYGGAGTRRGRGDAADAAAPARAGRAPPATKRRAPTRTADAAPARPTVPAAAARRRSIPTRTRRPRPARSACGC
ncbi:hypothetical protein ACU686_37765 [Yinghuangia aomiensis]